MDDPQSDQQLLQRARSAGDRAAFDTLIRRYANLVYGIAMRQTRDAQLAADISQAVFIVFVRRIRSIHHARALPGWFLKTTRFAVRDVKRSADRRAFHEHQAAASRTEQAMSQNRTDQAAELAVLDDAIASLGRTDRDLVLMRYLQGRDFAVIAATLGITEPAVRKRLGRAIERMRKFFNSNGATLSVVSVTGLLGSATTIVAPAAVVEASVVAATAGGVASASAAATIAKGVIHIMAWTKIEIAACGLAILAVSGIGSFLVVAKLRSDQAKNPTAVAHEVVREPLPQTLAEANQRMQDAYGLAAGEVIRVIPPPVSELRRTWLSLYDKERNQYGDPEVIRLNWTDESGFQVSGWGSGDASIGSLKSNLSLDWHELDGVDRIIWPPLYGDTVVRYDASRQQKIDALAAFIKLRTGAEFSIASTRSTRPCVVLHEELRRGSFRRPDGFAVFVSQKPANERWISQSQGRHLPPGFQDCLGASDLGRILDAPVILGGGKDSSPNIYLVAADAHLDHFDPEYRTKLQRVLNNLNDQIGGKWSIEDREIESSSLRPQPAPHPVIDIVNTFVRSAVLRNLPGRNEGEESAQRQFETIVTSRVVENDGVFGLYQISADQFSAQAISDFMVDGPSRGGRLVFLLSNGGAGWTITNVAFHATFGSVTSAFLADHPKAGYIRPRTMPIQIQVSH